jgi:transposase
MNESGLFSYTGVGEILGISRITVSDLVEKLGLVPKPMSNGRAKGLDRDDIEAIRQRLRRARVTSDRLPVSSA